MKVIMWTDLSSLVKCNFNYPDESKLISNNFLKEKKKIIISITKKFHFSYNHPSFTAVDSSIRIKKILQELLVADDSPRWYLSLVAYPLRRDDYLESHPEP